MLIGGQTYDTPCPYFWSFCRGGMCDGCDADQGQGVPASTPPWAKGTSIEDRHELVRKAAHAPDDSLMRELFDDAWSWRRRILGE